MDKETMRLGGRSVRVEVNWNALSAFLVAVGRDTLEGLSNISSLKPSEIAALVAAAVNEGERLEGRESSLTALDVGAQLRPEDVGEFLQIYIRQSRPAREVEEPSAKKKTETDT